MAQVPVPDLVGVPELDSRVPAGSRARLSPARHARRNPAGTHRHIHPPSSPSRSPPPPPPHPHPHPHSASPHPLIPPSPTPTVHPFAAHPTFPNTITSLRYSVPFLGDLIACTASVIGAAAISNTAATGRRSDRLLAAAMRRARTPKRAELPEPTN
jgi:hypothetical protein